MAAVKDALGVDSRIVVGGRGQFDVEADGKLIFSKQKEQRFPEHLEIIDALRSLDLSSS